MGRPRGRTRCAVLGSPIAHSLSPALHRAAYAELGLTDWSYDRFEVDEDGFGGFVARLSDAEDRAQWRGLSLTMPLKAAAARIGTPSDEVRLTGVANTLIVEPDGTVAVHNTDIAGLVQALRAAGVDDVGRVCVLGAGGTARAALVSVAALGARSVQVLARRPEQISALSPLAAELGLDLLGGDFDDTPDPADLLLSTVTAAAVAEKVQQDAAGLDRVGAVFDVVYDPWPTPLAAAARAGGRTVINGLDLLAHQAVGQLELMTGRTVDPQLLLAAGRAELGARPGA